MEQPLHTHPSTHPPKVPQKSDHPPDDEQKQPVSRVTLALSGEKPEKSARQTHRQSLHKEKGVPLFVTTQQRRVIITLPCQTDWRSG